MRTLGMPGLGALGVTFGQVVAMDSPSATQAGRLQLGQHAVARDEPCLHSRHHQPPRAALVYRRTCRPRGDAGLAGVGRPDHARHRGRPRDKKLLPVADLDRGFVRPEYPAQVHRLLLPGGPHLRLHPGPLERRQASRHGALLRPAQDHPGGDSAGLGNDAGGIRQAVSGLAVPTGRRPRGSLRRVAHEIEGPGRAVQEPQLRRGAQRGRGGAAASIPTTFTTPIPTSSWPRRTSRKATRRRPRRS